MNLLCCVVLCCNLILDENLCDCHAKFMLCRGQSDAIRFVSFNGEIPNEEQTSAWALSSEQSQQHSTQRAKTIKTEARCTQSKRNGTMSVRIADGPRFGRVFLLCFVHTIAIRHTNGRFPLVSFFRILLFIYVLALYGCPIKSGCVYFACMRTVPIWKDVPSHFHYENYGHFVSANGNASFSFYSWNIFEILFRAKFFICFF